MCHFIALFLYLPKWGDLWGFFQTRIPWKWMAHQSPGLMSPSISHYLCPFLSLSSTDVCWYSRFICLTHQRSSLFICLTPSVCPLKSAVAGWKPCSPAPFVEPSYCVKHLSMKSLLASKLILVSCLSNPKFNVKILKTLMQSNTNTF